MGSIVWDVTRERNIMESSISRIASRFEKNLNLNRNQASRESQDRARAERERDYERRRMMQNSVTPEQIRDVVLNSNEEQLESIQDMFYDARLERDSSDKEIIRAVDGNSKLLNKNWRLLNDIKTEMDSEERIDIRSLSEENKEEILKAVLSNTDILNKVLDNTEIILLIKEELESRSSELVTLIKEEIIDKKAEEEQEKEDNTFDKATAEKAFIDLEDHVHKENVKCYRNVQNALAEQDAQTFGKINKEFSRLKGLVIAALVFGIADLAFMLCWYLRII